MFKSLVGRVVKTAPSLVSRNQRITARFGSHGHGVEEFKEPTGWLFNEPPRKSGEDRPLEAWEMPWYIFMFGGIAVYIVGQALKPDYSLQTWAKEEAERRIAKMEEDQKARGEQTAAERGPWKFDLPPVEIKKLLDETKDVEDAALFVQLKKHAAIRTESAV